MADVVPTRSAYLELQEERRGMQEGYRFLDEKRLVLAGEIIARLAPYEAARQDFEALYRRAVAALRGAVERHGLEQLELYPPLHFPQARLQVREHGVLGVRVGEARWESGPSRGERPVFASPEAGQCRERFQEVIAAAAALAAARASLLRLWHEYRRTSRRARALEDVLLPEMQATLRMIDAGLEEQDREEAVRVRHFQRLGEA